MWQHSRGTHSVMFQSCHYAPEAPINRLLIQLKPYLRPCYRIWIVCWGRSKANLCSTQLIKSWWRYGKDLTTLPWRPQTSPLRHYEPEAPINLVLFWLKPRPIPLGALIGVLRQEQCQSLWPTAAKVLVKVWKWFDKTLMTLWHLPIASLYAKGILTNGYAFDSVIVCLTITPNCKSTQLNLLNPNSWGIH